MTPVVQHLGEAQADAFADVLSEAFFDYPVMRFVVGDGHDDYDTRLRELVGFFVYRRARSGGPLLGINDGGQLVAAAAMTLPAEPDPPADVLARRDRLWQALGQDARARYEQYSQAAKSVLVTRPHHHLNMIGVRRAWAGRGLSRPLLERAAALAADDPASGGVSLTTETEKNVALYRHFGYEVTGRAEVAPGFETWGMFLETA